MPDGSTHRVARLLSPGDGNYKQNQGRVRYPRYLPVNLALAPNVVSGRNVCPRHTAGCASACLYYAGRGQLVSVRRARIARTMLYHRDRPRFLRMLHRELHRWRGKARRQGKILAVRLNVFSDIAWERLDSPLFTTFADVRFYDYTKCPERFSGALPQNYYLIFSRSEDNEAEALDLLSRGHNVAVVFRRRRPATWHGYRVIDGDAHDYRFLDPSPRVVALSAKGRPGRRDRSGFVIR